MTAHDAMTGHLAATIADVVAMTDHAPRPGWQPMAGRPPRPAQPGHLAMIGPDAMTGRLGATTVGGAMPARNGRAR